MQLIECVPNFSEGRGDHKIEAIANVIKQVGGVQLLHIDIGYDANRTVMTFVGEPAKVVEAAYLAYQKTQKSIDMRFHKGAHPRMGSIDVCPLIPLANITLEEVNVYAQELGKQVGDLGIPVYLYESSAKQELRKNLATIRKGEYEGLKSKMKLKEWESDYGPNSFNESSGATAIGARNFLIAYNVNLKTDNVQIAKRIAAIIREIGFQKEGVRIPGKLQKVKAIGWYMEAYQCAQVSTNIIDFNTTSLASVYETIKEVAIQVGTTVTGSELVGMIPEKCWQQCVQHYQMEEENIVQYLGLDSVRPFDFKERIIERKMKFS